MKSSKKLVPRLFGVNKESIVRVDERTKEVLQVMLYTNFTKFSTAALMILFSQIYYMSDVGVVLSVILHLGCQRYSMKRNTN